MDLLLNILLVILNVYQLGAHLTHDLYMSCCPRASLRTSRLVVFQVAAEIPLVNCQLLLLEVMLVAPSHAWKLWGPWS